MIFGITGSPGDGKTSTAVKWVFDNIHNYKVIITNVRGFNIDLIKKASGWNGIFYELTDDEIYLPESIEDEKKAKEEEINELNDKISSAIKDTLKTIKNTEFEDIAIDYEDTFKNALSKVIEEQKKKTKRNANDEVVQIFEHIANYNNPSKVHDSFKLPTLVILDECHKQLRAFSNREIYDVFKSDFLSQHRHFSCDMILITQQPSKIALIYRNDVAFWYKSVQQEFKDGDHIFKFKKWDSDIQNEITGMGLEFNSKKPIKGVDGKTYSIFDFYNSGDGGQKRIKRFSKIRQLKIYLALAIIASLLGIWNFTNRYKEKVEKLETTPKTKVSSKPIKSSSKITKDNNTSNIHQPVINDYTQYKLKKIFFDGHWYHFNDILFSQKEFEDFISDGKIVIFYKFLLMKGSYYYYSYVTNEFDSLFNENKENKKGNKSVIPK